MGKEWRENGMTLQFSANPNSAVFDPHEKNVSLCNDQS